MLYTRLFCYKVKILRMILIRYIYFNYLTLCFVTRAKDRNKNVGYNA